MEIIELFKKAFHEDDAAALRQLFEAHPEMKPKINEPVGPFESPAITMARSPEMIDVLLDAGADLNAKSRWWAGGFGLLHTAEPGLARYAIRRGAVVDVHAAARLGMIDRLCELISADPALVHARGGDGQTPLHFAQSVEVAQYLLEHGAEVDARDVDHESTPAQYMVTDRSEIARFLIRNGCKTDLLMASAVGDIGLVREHLDAGPECVRLRVSSEFFPMIGAKAGGTIYQWTLGWYVSAHQIAKKLGHEEIFQLLMERSPDELKLITACWLGDEATVRSLLSLKSDLVNRLSAADRRQIAHAARNNDSRAVRLMLTAGLPVDAVGQHAATPLHWAAFHGNLDMAKTILSFHPPLEKLDADFQATPLGWAIHGSEHGWHCRTGSFPEVTKALLEAGAKLPEKIGGTAGVQEVLRRHRAGRSAS